MPLCDMKLEKITTENLETAIQVAREIFPYEIHAGEFWPEAGYKEAIALNQCNFAYYLVYVEREVVGITGHYSPEDGKPEIWIGWFGVRPAYRRNGYGTKILEATAEIISAFGCSSCKLYSGDREEERAAQRIYLRQGFELTGRGEVDGMPVLYFTAKLPLGITYSSKQATECAVCGKRKHTPLRRDHMGGYVCLTCIDRQLDQMLAASRKSVTSRFCLGQKVWISKYRRGQPSEPQQATIGKIELEIEEDKVVEEYMCHETGVGTGMLYTLGENIFETEEECRRFCEEDFIPANPKSANKEDK